jgi:hypothetical protein
MKVGTFKISNLVAWGALLVVLSLSVGLGIGLSFRNGAVSEYEDWLNQESTLVTFLYLENTGAGFYSLGEEQMPLRECIYRSNETQMSEIQSDTIQIRVPACLVNMKLAPTN